MQKQKVFIVILMKNYVISIYNTLLLCYTVVAKTIVKMAFLCLTHVCIFISIKIHAPEYT